MNGPLEASVTLEEVLAVVVAKRVPLAPELAGYLSLEVAEGADAAGGEVDPRFVYIGDEGTVALVRPRRENPSGDAEASIRAILVRLLEASGAQTPALGAAARKKQAAGLPGLVEELEAALIPVNRGAGRRALARLAREVKRVTMGVGRNAPSRTSSPSHAGRESQADARSSRSTFSEDPAVTAKRDVPQEVLANSVPSEALVAGSAAPSSPALDPPTIEFRKDQLAAASPGSTRAPRSPTPAPPAVSPSDRAPAGPDEVDHLLESFAVSGTGEQAAANALKKLVGLEPTPPPPASSLLQPTPVPPAVARKARQSAPPPPSDSDVESLLAMSDPGPAIGQAPARARSSEPAPPLSSPPPPRPSPPPQVRPSSTSAPTGPSMRKLGGSDLTRPRGARADRVLAVVALVVLVGAAGTAWLLKPVFFGGRSPERIEEEHKQADLARMQAASAQQAAARCKATLIVGDVPYNAEVLLRVGQAPADVERMPVGARLEFVATAEGYAPRRTVVPAGAKWDTGPDGKPRFEVGVQLDKSRARPGGVDNWPPAEPGSEVGGKGLPGTVHIVSTPRGAELWLLAGIGPEARIDQLRCAADVDVLVAGPTTLRKRIHVAAKDFTGAEPSVTVSAVGR